jgi:hypothetical protein
MSAQRAIYIGFDKSLVGREGNCAPVEGHDDPEDFHYGAYMFQADGDECAYYVDPQEHLQMLPG